MKQAIVVAVIAAVCASAITALVVWKIASDRFVRRGDYKGSFDDYIEKTTGYIDGRLQTASERIDGLRSRIETLESRH